MLGDILDCVNAFKPGDNETISNDLSAGSTKKKPYADLNYLQESINNSLIGLRREEDRTFCVTCYDHAAFTNKPTRPGSLASGVNVDNCALSLL